MSMKGYAKSVIVVFCYILRGDEILLIERANPPAMNEYTVVGGKKEFGEDLIAACKREAFEESGLVVDDLEYRGVITSSSEADFEVSAFYFRTRNFQGELKESDEGRLQWCGVDESFEKEGISPYYVAISPHVLGEGGVFVARMRSQRGELAEFEVL